MPDEYYLDENGFLTKISPITLHASHPAEGGNFSSVRNLQRHSKNSRPKHKVSRRKARSKIQPNDLIKDTLQSELRNSPVSNFAQRFVSTFLTPPNSHQGGNEQKAETPNKQNTRTSTMIQCPYCKVMVRNYRLKRHVFEKCPVAKKSVKQSVKSRTLHSMRAEDQEQVSALGLAIEKAFEIEALNQSFDETRYAGKYLGHMRREWDGKFGSLPLYDDHDDESNPEGE
mgnify:CR=1 FL=1